MPNGSTNSGNLTQLWVAEYLAREITLALAQVVEIQPLVHTEMAVNSNQVKFPMRESETAATFDEDTGMTIAAYAMDSVNVTLGPVGLVRRVSGFLDALAPQTLSVVVDENALAIGRAVDIDLAALFPSFSTSVDDSGNALSIDDWIAGVGNLNAQNVPNPERFGVISSQQWSDLLASIKASPTTIYAQADTAKTGQIADLYGVNAIRSNFVPTLDSGANACGLMFRRPALGLGTIEGVRVKVMDAPAQYDAKDISTTKYYGVALVQDLSATKLISKATA